MIEDGTVRICFVNGDFRRLNNGTYEMKDLSLRPGRYAVYTTSGSKVAGIGEEKYNLDSELLEDH